MNFRNLIYALTCTSFTIVLGAAIYEHTAVWPNAFAEPPRSLHMFQGQYPLHAEPFWMSIHPVSLILFITSLILFWKTERRNYVLIPLTGYIIVLISTAIFFVPTLLHITRMPFSDTVNMEMKSLGQLWITLSIIRAFVLFGLSMTLFMGLTKPVYVINRVIRKFQNPMDSGAALSGTV